MALGCENSFNSKFITLDQESYAINANKSNVNGYSLDLCYNCTITPLGLSPIIFYKDKIHIE